MRDWGKRLRKGNDTTEKVTEVTEEIVAENLESEISEELKEENPVVLEEANSEEIHEENSAVLEEEKKSEELKEEVKEAPITPEPVKMLTPVEIEKTLRLAREITIVNKDLEILELKNKDFFYEEQLLLKQKTILDKTIEITKLKGQLALTTKKELQGKMDHARENYIKHSNELGKRLNVDFSKCAFDPVTGTVEVV